MESKPLAFFSSKSPKHTWRHHLQERFKEYLDCYLTNPNAVSNIFGEDAQVPTEIPCFFKVSKVRGKQSEAPALVVYVGIDHHSNATTLMKAAPFEDNEMILFSNKQQNPSMFDKQLDIHIWLCQKSTAVKLRYTTKLFCSAIRWQIQEDENIKKAVVDVAEALSTESKGTMYIQCLTTHQPSVLTFAENFIAAYNTLHPNDSTAEIVLPRSMNMADQLISPNQTVNTWSQWQDFMEEDTLIRTRASRQHTPKVPGTIKANHSYSYASMVAGHHQHSNISSPTESRTGHQSVRVTELELENERLWSCLQELEQSPRSTSTCSKSSTKSKQEIELETEVNQVKSLLAHQMEKFDGLEKQFNMLLRRLTDQDSDTPPGSSTSA